MKIIRYASPEVQISYGSEESNGSRKRIDGDIFDGFSVIKETAHVAQLLAPIAPVAIWRTGRTTAATQRR